MNRRDFLRLTTGMAAATMTGCALARIDPDNVLVRSPYITSNRQEQEILARAKLSQTQDGQIRVLFVRGTAYERGYQHGVLLRKEINDNLGYMYEQGLKKFRFEELLAEVYERVRPYIPEEYVEEMHGLAHGARMPLHQIHHLHILPDIGEWGGRKHIEKLLRQMMHGEELGTSCSNFAVSKSATADGRLYAVRILDWGLHRISKLHRYPLLTVGVPDKGYAYCNIGWVGFLGAVSGMNERGITLGEMGYGDPPNETLFGKPMIFLLREILSYDNSLADVRSRISGSPGTESFGFLMSDGKRGDAELYVRDRDRFLPFGPGVDLRDRKDFFPAIKDIVYGGHYQEKMTKVLNQQHGKMTPEVLMKEVIPPLVMPSNFQNVVYDPAGLRFWVNNAKNKEISAESQPYSEFRFGEEVQQFRS